MGHNRSARKSRTILIVDDHSLFRQGIRQLIEGDGRFTVVAEAASGHAALQQIEIHQPEIMLLDVQLPGLTGLSVANIVRQQYPNLKVVILTMHLDDERLFLALQAGAYGFLTKDIETDELLGALERVANGERILNDVVFTRPEFAVPILTQIREGGNTELDVMRVVPKALKFPLSAREAEVLDCVAQGLSNKEVGEALFISEQTVKNHMTSVLRKLSVEDRLQAVVSGVRNGWIDIGSTDYVVTD